MQFGIDREKKKKATLLIFLSKNTTSFEQMFSMTEKVYFQAAEPLPG